MRRPGTRISAAVLIAAAIACGRGSDSSQPEGGAAAPGAAPAATVDAVRAFNDFAAELQPSDRMEPATIAEGLRGLAGAAGTVGAAPPEVLVDLRVVPEHVLLNPGSPEVAATVRAALVSVGQSLASTEAGKATAVQKAAESIQADTPLPEQGAALRAFFQEAAKVTSAAAQTAP